MAAATAPVVATGVPLSAEFICSAMKDIQCARPACVPVTAMAADVGAADEAAAAAVSGEVATDSGDFSPCAAEVVP